jgi:hypothetical protein
MENAALRQKFDELITAWTTLSTLGRKLGVKERNDAVASLTKKSDHYFIDMVKKSKVDLDQFFQLAEQQPAKPVSDDPQPVAAALPKPLLVELPAAAAASVDSLNKLPEPTTKKKAAAKKEPVAVAAPAPAPAPTPAPAPEEPKKRGGRKPAAASEEPAAAAPAAKPKLNSYHQFFKETRPSIAAANPSWTPQQITTELGRLWSEKKETSSVSSGPDTKEDLSPIVAPAPSPAPAEELATAAAAEDDKRQPLHVRRKKIPKNIRSLVWNKYIGADITAAKCMCCREEKITINNWHCGHVLAEARGGDTTINNLRPICAPCNSSMGTKSMNEFTEEYFGWSVAN